MTTPTNEADVIFNRANIALARSQRLVASWLPPKSDEELAQQTKSEEELQREEDEIFTAVPEKYVPPDPSFFLGIFFSLLVLELDGKSIDLLLLTSFFWGCV